MAVYGPYMTIYIWLRPNILCTPSSPRTHLSRRGVETGCRDKVWRQGVETRCRDKVSRQGVGTRCRSKVSIRDATTFSPRQSRPRRLQTLLGDSGGAGGVSNTTRTSRTPILRPRARQAWSRKSCRGSQLANFYQQKYSVLLSSDWACVVQDQCLC